MTNKISLFRYVTGVVRAVSILIFLAQTLRAQQNLLGNNLIVNGDAESGAASKDNSTPVASIPGWTRTGNVTVLAYDTPGLSPKSPLPSTPGFQFFNGISGTLSQDIDVSPISGLLGGGAIVFSASAYVEGVSGAFSASMTVSFRNANNQTLTSITVGPVNQGVGGFLLLLQRQIGLVPPSTTRITVTLNLSGSNADNLSLVLTSPGAPESILGTNIIVNGDAEAGPGVPISGSASYVPGWSPTTAAFRAVPYNSPGFIKVGDPGPDQRGTNGFYGGPAYQDIDVSAAAALIDSSTVLYQLTGWLSLSANLTFEFFDWSGKQLAPTLQISQTGGLGLVSRAQNGSLPSGTRRVHIDLNLSVGAAADNLSFVLVAPALGGRPSSTPNGIVSSSAFGAFTSVAAGSWIEIYGANLSTTTHSWSAADFVSGVGPLTLNGVAV
jgi:hypothetical protein